MNVIGHMILPTKNHVNGINPLNIAHTLCSKDFLYQVQRSGSVDEHFRYGRKYTG